VKSRSKRLIGSMSEGWSGK